MGKSTHFIGQPSPPQKTKWMDRLQIIDSVTITLFSNYRTPIVINGLFNTVLNMITMNYS